MKRLVLEGSSPRNWGQQHGETLKNEIHELNNIRQGLLRKYLKSWDSEKIQSLCQAHIHTLKKSYPSLFEEVSGTSEASGLPLEDLMILNAYTDLRDFSYGEAARIEDGCSTIAVSSPMAHYAAQTWDMHGNATPYTLLLEYPEQKVLSVAGCLGLAGVNRSGVAVMINNMHCSEVNAQGLLWTGLVRKMLEQHSAQSAREYLRRNAPSSGHNYLLSDSKEFVNIETTGKQQEETHAISRDQDNGFILHTNHYTGKLKKHEIIERQSPTTHRRLEALQNYFAKNAFDTLDSAQLTQDLFVDGAPAEVICIPCKDTSSDAGATCGGIIVDYKNEKVCCYQGLLKDAKTIKFDLNF